MYFLFLLLCVLAVVLSPLALELWLNGYELRAERRRARKVLAVRHPELAWLLYRLR